MPAPTHLHTPSRKKACSILQIDIKMEVAAKQKQLYNLGFIPVGAPQVENLSTHGMSGVLNESKHERVNEGETVTHVCGV